MFLDLRILLQMKNHAHSASCSHLTRHGPYVEIPAQKFKAFAAGRPDLIEAPDVEPENQVSAEPALNNPSLEARSADFETLSYDHMMFQSYLELSIKMLTETLVKTDDSMSNGSFRGLGSL